jgi:hypothetical protein
VGLPAISYFTASPTAIGSNQTATLNWTVTGATSVYLDGNLVTATSQSVSPAVTTIYTLTATNSVGTASKTATVTVTNVSLPQIISFTATPSSIARGQSSILSWSIIGADSISIDQGIGTPSSYISQTVEPINTTTYTLTATNIVGSVTKTVPVTVTP